MANLTNKQKIELENVREAFLIFVYDVMDYVSQIGELSFESHDTTQVEEKIKHIDIPHNDEFIEVYKAFISFIENKKKEGKAPSEDEFRATYEAFQKFIENTTMDNGQTMSLTLCYIDKPQIREFIKQERESIVTAFQATHPSLMGTMDRETVNLKLQESLGDPEFWKKMHNPLIRKGNPKDNMKCGKFDGLWRNDDRVNEIYLYSDREIQKILFEQHAPAYEIFWSENTSFFKLRPLLEDICLFLSLSITDFPQDVIDNKILVYSKFPEIDFSDYGFKVLPGIFIKNDNIHTIRDLFQTLQYREPHPIDWELMNKKWNFVKAHIYNSSLSLILEEFSSANKNMSKTILRETKELEVKELDESMELKETEENINLLFESNEKYNRIISEFLKKRPSFINRDIYGTIKTYFNIICKRDPRLSHVDYEQNYLELMQCRSGCKTMRIVIPQRYERLIFLTKLHKLLKDSTQTTLYSKGQENLIIDGDNKKFLEDFIYEYIDKTIPFRLPNNNKKLISDLKRFMKTDNPVSDIKYLDGYVYNSLLKKLKWNKSNNLLESDKKRFVYQLGYFFDLEIEELSYKAICDRVRDRIKRYLKSRVK